MDDLVRSYKLEKRVWSDKDFAVMGWHDCQIYKIALEGNGNNGNLLMDIDYILKWNQPELEGLPFTFWIAPATIAFRNINQLHFDFELSFDDSFEIDEIQRSESETNYQWTIITQEGYIQFLGHGYDQFIRQDPFYEFGQAIPYFDRYGYSLATTTQQENPNRGREDVMTRRLKNMENYELAKKRHLKKQEIERLINEKESNQIDTKIYLQKKREITELIESYNFWLKGTRFENW